MAQIMTIETAIINVTGLPVIRAVDFANRENHDLDFVGLIGSSSRINQIVMFISHAVVKATIQAIARRTRFRRS
jgi:hypothetical protein